MQILITTDRARVLLRRFSKRTKAVTAQKYATILSLVREGLNAKINEFNIDAHLSFLP
jgi:hypothetical protein